MRNRISVIVMAAAVSHVLGCVSVDAVDTEDEVGRGIEVIHPGNARSQGLVKLPELRIEHLEGAQLQSGGLAPAQGVTYFQAYAVGSSNIGWEYLDEFQFTTVSDHGGALLRVAVLQYGYGNGGASLNGASGVNYLSETLCGSLSTLHYCSVGEVVTGFLDYYSFDGAQGGGFSAFTNSIASPFGQKTDAITIR